MLTHETLALLRTRALRMQGRIRRETFNPAEEKTLRRFSSWEVAELIFRINQSTFRGRLAADPALPGGEVEPDGRQRWFSLDEINTLRRAMKVGGRSLLPPRPRGRRALRTAIANFKGGAGKSTVALHFAHAAALDGYRVLCVDFDPQATLSHAMGLTDVAEDHTVWGIIARDLVRETDRMNAMPRGAMSGAALPQRKIPAGIRNLGLDALRVADFIRPTAWPTIDIVPSCANAAFVEFASAQYRHLNPDWTFFASVARWLAQIPDDSYDLIFFDCPPAIGYQSMNAVFAADLLWIPSGPGYWEYDSTTSFLGQLAEALADLGEGYGPTPDPGPGPGPGLSAGLGQGLGGVAMPKGFAALRFLMTRYEPGNDLHRAMLEAFRSVWGDHVTQNPIEATRAVEQSGRFLASIYEIDYRLMTRDTWRRARDSFDRAWAEFRATALTAWDGLEDRG